MSNMSSDAGLVAYFNNMTNQMNRYPSILIFLFGTVGNILNTLVLSQPEFRSNPCAILFLFSSVANFIAILAGLTSRILSVWVVDLTNTDRFLCKLRAFILNVARPVAFWLIFLAAIDRWLLSNRNAHYRQMSTLKNARRSMIIILIFAIIIFSHILYCHEPNQVNAPMPCYGKTITCRLVTDTLFTFVSTFSPILLMFMFGLMTINNVRKSRSAVQPRDVSIENPTVSSRGQQRQQLNKVEYHLIVMLLVQTLLLLILGLPLGIQKLYGSITINRPTSKVQAAIDNFVYNFALLLNLFANGMPFYIYTLFGGNVFRKGIFKIFLAIGQRVSRLRRVFHL